MKTQITTKMRNWLMAFFFVAFASPSMACDLSSFTLKGVTSLGSNKYKIDVAFCAGGGKSSTRFGADQNTTNFAFYLLGRNIKLDTMSKDTMISPNTGDVFQGWKFIDSTLYSVPYYVPVLYYLDWNWNSTWACIGSTCGVPRAICGSVSIYTTGLPDTILCRGMEAGGNILGGCTKLMVFPRCYNSTLTASLGSNKTVYNGTNPNCATLAPTVSGGSGTYTYKWNTAATTSSITVCPTASTNYSLEVKDSYGCSTNTSVTVIYKDIRCGSTLSKVNVCYRGSTKCISKTSLQSYLNSGATLGACGSAAAPLDPKEPTLDPTLETTFDLRAFPNPASTGFQVTFNGTGNDIKVNIVNLFGQEVKVLFENATTTDRTTTLDVSTLDLSKGIYILQASGLNAKNEPINISQKIIIQ